MADGDMLKPDTVFGEGVLEDEVKYVYQFLFLF